MARAYIRGYARKDTVFERSSSTAHHRECADDLMRFEFVRQPHDV